MVSVEIRTGDVKWASKNGTPGRNGRTVVKVSSVEHLTFGPKNAHMIRFALPSAPNDAPSVWTMVPVSYMVSES